MSRQAPGPATANFVTAMRTDMIGLLQPQSYRSLCLLQLDVLRNQMNAKVVNVQAR